MLRSRLGAASGCSRGQGVAAALYILPIFLLLSLCSLVMCFLP
jgi:hypothetical protein